MWLRSFKKNGRNLGTAKSTGTILAKKLVARLEREDGAKSKQKTQTNVERNSTDRSVSEKGSTWGEEEDI